MLMIPVNNPSGLAEQQNERELHQNHLQHQVSCH